MEKQIKWLLVEIDWWVSEGLIEPAQAAALKSRYPVPAEAVSWSRIIFFSLGAVLAVRCRHLDKFVSHRLERSRYDLDTTKAMLDAGRYLYVAYMCQQAVEKLMKT
jgi:hypothetical protein